MNPEKYGSESTQIRKFSDSKPVLTVSEEGNYQIICMKTSKHAIVRARSFKDCVIILVKNNHNIDDVIESNKKEQEPK